MAYMGQEHCLECGYNADADESNTLIDKMGEKLKEKDLIIESLRHDLKTSSKIIGNMKKHLNGTYWLQFINDEEE
jgi:hypothetical protein